MEPVKCHVHLITGSFHIHVTLYLHGNILPRKDITERFHFSDIPPRLYNSVIYAISKYLTCLSIDKSTLRRDCTTFMSLY